MDNTPITVLLRGCLDQIQPSIRRVAQYVLADPSRAADLTIVNLAAECGVSQSTVVRLCHEIGLAATGSCGWHLRPKAVCGRRTLPAGRRTATSPRATLWPR